MVRVSTPPTATFTPFHAMVLAVGVVTTPLVALAETNIKSGGKVSTKFPPVAGAGPRLDISISNVT